MITPSEDKTFIKALLDTDEYIAKAEFLADNIKTTKYGTDTLNSGNQDFQIFIYLGNPENPNSWIQKGVVYNVCASGRRTLSDRVDSVMAQIIAILSEAEIGRGHILHLLDPPMELESDPAMYLVECSFICYSTIFNKRK